MRKNVYLHFFFEMQAWYIGLDKIYYKIKFLCTLFFFLSLSPSHSFLSVCLSLLHTLTHSVPPLLMQNQFIRSNPLGLWASVRINWLLHSQGWHNIYTDIYNHICLKRFVSFISSFIYVLVVSHSYTNTHMHAIIHTNSHMHVCTHTRTYEHRHTHGHTHRHTHTFILML